MARSPEIPKVGAEQQVEDDIQTSTLELASVVTPPTQIELLLKTVENELIPRLFVNHMMDVPVTSPLVEHRATNPAPGPWSEHDQIVAFAEMCISNDPERLDRHVTDLLAQSVTLESIFLYLLTPVARYLGDQWLQDELSFVDVQLGLCRLHQLICECETIGYQSENVTFVNRSILLSSAPGEDHTFGVTMVADFFRRYGWQVSNLCGLDPDFILARLSSTHYTAVGFSLHNDSNYQSLVDVIRNIRQQAANPEMVILVGGDYFTRHPSNVRAAGADLYASDGHQAVVLACESSGMELVVT